MRRSQKRKLLILFLVLVTIVVLGVIFYVFFNMKDEEIKNSEDQRVDIQESAIDNSVADSNTDAGTDQDLKKQEPLNEDELKKLIEEDAEEEKQSPVSDEALVDIIESDKSSILDEEDKKKAAPLSDAELEALINLK